MTQTAAAPKVITFAELVEWGFVPEADYRNSGWSDTDLFCERHGTGYSPGCPTCRKLAGR
jgi:hypothetical protein